MVATVQQPFVPSPSWRCILQNDEPVFVESPEVCDGQTSERAAIYRPRFSSDFVIAGGATSLDSAPVFLTPSMGVCGRLRIAENYG